jgi:polyhydroxyalkanoate synthesis regulator phasin
MTENVENLVLEQLRAIRATQTEHGNRLIQIELQLSAMGQQLGGLTTAVYSGKSELDELRNRVDRIERRLELQPA